MAKTIYNSFKNQFSYSAGIEKWCKDFYLSTSGNKLEYTFCGDFALADWRGEDAVKETYNRVIKSWGSDYKAFTEIALALNLLSWANDQLSRQGIVDRDKYTGLYSEMYYKARDDFYKKFENNSEACNHFFNMTD